MSENSEHLIFWMISLFPYSSKEFLENHEKALTNRAAYHYVCRDSVEMISMMAESFEKLADTRLCDSLEKFGQEIRKAFYKPRLKVNIENPIVKKHVIAQSQDDIDKERYNDSDPIKIEVNTPVGKTVFVKNISECSLDNPAKIDVED